MAITTLATFLGDLAAVGASVPSVVTVLTEPPLSLNTADLPVSWSQPPISIEETQIPFCDGSGFPAFTGQFVVAFEPVGQSRMPENYSGTIALADEILTAFRSTRITKSALSRTITLENIPVAEIMYWAVVTTVTGAG